MDGVALSERFQALLTMWYRATHCRGRAGAAVEYLSHRTSRDGKSTYKTPSHPGTKHLGLLINALGWGLAFRAGVGVLLTALTIQPLLARIRAEERLLRTEFGAAYGTYCVRTSRLIPGLY